MKSLLYFFLCILVVCSYIFVIRLDRRQNEIHEIRVRILENKVTILQLEQIKLKREGN